MTDTSAISVLRGLLSNFGWTILSTDNKTVARFGSDGPDVRFTIREDRVKFHVEACLDGVTPGSAPPQTVRSLASMANWAAVARYRGDAMPGRTSAPMTALAFEHGGRERFMDCLQDYRRGITSASIVCRCPTLLSRTGLEDSCEELEWPRGLDLCVGSAGDDQRRILITATPDIDLAAIVYNVALKLIDRAVEDADSDETVVPIIIDAAEVRVGSLKSEVEKMFRQVTGLSYDFDLIRSLMHLGFVHLLVVEFERLRIDRDFDPNNTFVADILVACGASRRLTLACDRHYVFHDTAPSLSDFAKSGAESVTWRFHALRTLGQRFYLDERFMLMDVAPLSLDDAPKLREQIEDEVEEAIRHLVKSAAGRLSATEARALLQGVALAEGASEGGVPTPVQIDEAISAVMPAARRRRTNRSYVAAALRACPAIRVLSSGQILLRRPALRAALAAESVAEGLIAFEVGGDASRLRSVFQAPDLEVWSLRFGFAFARLNSFSAPAETMSKLRSEFRLLDGGTQGDSLASENAVKLLLAAVSYFADLAASRPSDISAATFISDLKVSGLALPQTTFRKLNMIDWEFQNCNLRSSIFDECNLSSTFFDDCMLGGVAFLNCSFDHFTSFRNSDLSGSWFSRANGLIETLRYERENRVANTVWTGAELRGPGLSPLCLQYIRRQGGVADMIAVGDASGMVVNDTPVTVWRALLGAVWNERPFFEGKIPRRPTTLTVEIRSVVGADYVTVAGEQMWFAVTNDGSLFCGPDSQSWRQLGGPLGEAISRATFDTMPRGSRTHVAAFSDSGTAYIIGISSDSTQVSWHKLALPDGGVSAGKWLDVEEVAVLAIGSRDGTFMLVTQTAGKWRFWARAGDATSPVDAFGYSPRDQVLFVARKGGLIEGHLVLDNNSFRTLFRFQSAIADVSDVVALPGRSHQLIVGGLVPLSLPEEDRRQRADFNRPLCILATADGSVLAAFAREVREVVALNPNDDHLIEEVMEDTGAGPETADVDMNSYVPSPAKLTFAGASDSEIVLRLVVTSAKNDLMPGHRRLVPLIETRQGPVFRSVEIEISTLPVEAAGAPPKIARTRFAETDVALEVTETGMAARFPIVFARGVSHADVRLKLAYSGRGRYFDKSFSFHITVDWSDNPYDPDGRPARGPRFFGREMLIDRCCNELLGLRSLKLCGPRRSGKTSILKQIVARLQRRGILAFQISLLDGTADSVRQSLPKLLADGLRRDVPGETGAQIADAVMRAAGIEPNIETLMETIVKIGRRFGFQAPVALLIDEWGILGNKESALYNESSIHAIGSLIVRDSLENDLVLLLSSTPGDFTPPDTLSYSNAYRSITMTVNLAPFTDSELGHLMRDPLRAREAHFDNDKAAFARLKRWSGGDPYAANVLLHRAFALALDRGLPLVLRSADLEDPGAKAVLRQIYAGHINYLLKALGQEHLAAFRDWANQDPPIWERNPPIRVSTSDPADKIWRIFMEAGFSRPASPDSMRPADTGVGELTVWIPRGLALTLAGDNADI